ncbi:MAG: hypothetical protein ACRC0G_03710 [Fusobacteriaceae bacterium]
MNRNECINYMISSEGFRTYLVDALNNGNGEQALQNEFTSILDSLCKENQITSNNYNNWKCPSLRYVRTRLKIKTTIIYI